jgi:putative glycosyltransferase (TIGR04372 family)
MTLIKNMQMLTMKRMTTLVSGFWSIPVVLLIRLIRPIVIVRLGTFFSNRIGHFVADSAHQFVKQDTNIIELYWLDNSTCNKQWSKMVKRNLPVYWWVKYVDIWNKYLPGGDIHSRPLSVNDSRDLYGLLDKHQGEMLKFIPEEEKKAKEWLKKQGWRDGDSFVCLLVRDSEYLDSENVDPEQNWDYHSFRNSDVNTYVEAMEWLSEQGVWVIRMGKVMSKRISTKNSRIVDYAFCPNRNDLLDIWLFANCNLCISTGSGIDYVSDVYRKPLLFLNYLPLNDMVSWSNSINYPKHLKWSDSDNLLTLKECLEHQFCSTKEYEEAGIDIIDLTSIEIKLVVQECWARLEDSFVETYNDINQQNQFWKTMRESTLFKKQHDFIHPKARLASTFLRNNPNFLR